MISGTCNRLFVRRLCVPVFAVLLLEKTPVKAGVILRRNRKEVLDNRILSE